MDVVKQEAVLEESSILAILVKGFPSPFKPTRMRDPRREKLLEARSNGHRHHRQQNNCPSLTGHFGHGRWGSSKLQNFIQQQVNRRIRRIPAVNDEGDGLVPCNKRTVDWNAT